MIDYHYVYAKKEKMKKFLIITAMCAASFMATSAQEVSDTKSDSYFGIRLGADLTCPGNVNIENVGVGIFKNGGGVELGIVRGATLVKNFYMELGLKLYYNTYSVRKDALMTIKDFYNINGLEVRKFGVRFPVVGGLNVNISDNAKLSFFTGPELEIGLSANEHIVSGDIDISESIYGEKGGMNRVNLLWDLGFGLTYQKFYFGMYSGFGLLNMVNDPDMSFHESRVTFSIGYNF